jgi:transcription elongation factor GreA
MSLKMAVNALQTLSKNHIWVLKATQKKEKLHERIKNDYVWTLKTIIKSFDNACDIKRIKAELVPGILSTGEWTTWSLKAKEILKSDPSFGISPDSVEVFTVRERPISIEEKLFNEFKAEKNFFDRVQTLRNFVAQKDIEPDSEYFTEMLDYFRSFLRLNQQTNEQIVASYLLVKEILAQYPHSGITLPFNFLEIFEPIEDVAELFNKIKDSKLKEDFLHHIKLFVPGWADIYVKLFPHALLNTILVNLVKEGYEEKLVAMTINCFENFREYREAVVWLFRNAAEESWYIKAGIPYEKQLITLIYILDISYREIENHRDTSENKKINKQVHNILFKESKLVNYIDTADPDTIIWIYTFINDVKDLDPQDKINLRSRILDKHPDLKFFESEEKAVSSLRGLIVTSAMYGEKQRQLAHIMEVEVPANSKEIETALLQGDLRENAEYKAAKEKQELLNSTAARLKEEIEQAQLFDPATVNTDRVSFGTKVTLKNKDSGKNEEYTILGPWESSPENGIISYLAPLGIAALNKGVGDTFDFTVNNEKISYTVKKISAAPF